MPLFRVFLFLIFCLPFVPALRPAAKAAPETELRYLSGHGPSDAIPWEFTVTGGRRAGEKTTLLVPSHWEQHGFGAYDYGQTGPKNDERGLYRLAFDVPRAWRDRRVRIVFEGSMTDTAVRVNGQSAGPVHQGGFNRFRHDITALLRFGEKNVLQVDVAKVSANPATEIAERGGDYWVFGGIYRPVYLEAVPARWIERTALDARADGSFAAEVYLGSEAASGIVSAQILDTKNKPVGAPFSARFTPGVSKLTLRTRLASPALWSAETPNLYRVRFTLTTAATDNAPARALHTVTERFGFRTFEVRPGQGFFLNGQRILLKGVGLHCFRPASGRALDPADSYADARLIKSMNMNAARMTHYPPDVALLDACDELGLYVLDELSGWQRAHDTENGRKLVRSMIERDVNHPSILFWDNGNEGGWNTALDADFALLDPQKRPVLHPWAIHQGIDTKHYSPYDDLVKRLAGPNIFMPTEVLHALYDGGGAAGLEDYWNAIAGSPFGGGAFIWVLADEGIKRTDQNGRIDVFATYAPDGIVGPHHEKEGSYHTIRDLYSPVQITPPVLDASFTGKLAVRNTYDFTPLTRCTFRWRLLRFAAPDAKGIAPKILARGTAVSPAIAPQSQGELVLELPATWRAADALALVATDPAGRELWTWTWPISAAPPPGTPSSRSASSPHAGSARKAPRLETTATGIRLLADDFAASFDPATGLLSSVTNGRVTHALTNGPRLAFARPPAKDITAWIDLPAITTPTNEPLVATLPSARLINVIQLVLDFPKSSPYAACKIEISPDALAWKTIYDHARRSGDGDRYEFSPQIVAAVRLSGIRTEDGQPVTLKNLRAGYASTRFPAASSLPAAVRTGESVDPQTGAPAVWLESTGAAGLDRFRWTLGANGDLRLDYAYTVAGEFAYHGVTFDHPETTLRSLRWLGEGPFHVWKNRLRGTTLGVHEIDRNETRPGETWDYPEFQGYFAGLRWARLATTSGKFTVMSDSPDTYLRVGTPRIGHINTSPPYPAGDLSFLAAIPPIGSKFVTTEKTGPASAWATAAGTIGGTLTFRFAD